MSAIKYSVSHAGIKLPHHFGHLTFSGSFVADYTGLTVTSIPSSHIKLSIDGFAVTDFTNFHLVYAEGVAGHTYNEISETESIFGIGTVTVTLDFVNGAHTLLNSSSISATLFGYSLGSAHFTNGGHVTTTPVCFMAGTMVATPTGLRAIETLEAGDLVLTSEGAAAPVRWLGVQTVSTRFADPVRVMPIRVRAGAMGDGLPRRDLLVSPCHALLVDGILIQAGALVNGTSIARETDVPEIFTYYHVELNDHSLILAEGVPAETFVDNIDRMAFDNWAERGDEAEAIAEMDYPRAQSARQVPAATRQRLSARGDALLGWTLQAAA
jgi:hypothetical protein